MAYKPTTVDIWDAARNGNLDDVKHYLAHGTTLDQRPPNLSNWTPLMAAAYGGHRTVVEYLVGRGADPNLTWAGRTAATYARIEGHKELAGLLSSMEKMTKEERMAKWGEPQQATTGSGVTSNPFAALEPLLDAVAPEPEEGHDKMLTDLKYFKFGDTNHFLLGFDAKLTRAMKTEFETNDNGRWWGEFLYVTRNGAISVPNVEPNDPERKAAQEKFTAIHPELTALRNRDAGNATKVCDDFFNSEEAQEANLTRAEVAAARLYTGPAFEPINTALRTEDVAPWATTIACLYSAVLKLSFRSKPARVYRGVMEGERKLPDKFLNAAADSFAGGVELGFMSTTTEPSVAMKFAGTGPGSIFVMDFNMASRGASLQFLSQFPHEAELLFPPSTLLECKQHDMRRNKRGNMRLVLVVPTISTARADTSGITTVDDAPSSHAASAAPPDISDLSISPTLGSASAQQAAFAGPIKIDEKQYDAYPETIGQTISTIRGHYDPAGVVFHYCSEEKLKWIEKGGMRIDPQGKGGGGLYFFFEGPDKLGYHGNIRYPEQFNTFVLELAAGGRGELELSAAKEAIANGPEAARKNQQWLEVCLVCYVKPKLLEKVEGRPLASYIPTNDLKDLKGCEQKGEHWHVSRSPEGCNIVDILGAIRIVYEPK